METAKKTAMEKRLVIGLLCIFGVTFAMALKNLGIFGRAGGAKPLLRASGVVQIKETLVETVQAHWKQMQPPPEPQAVVSAMPGRLSAAYTASDLRDPMKSVLPELPTPDTGGGEAFAQAEVKSPAVPPPSLTVRGVLWGGPEPQAIINDEVYRVGDSVEGARILSIDANGVTIEHQGTSAFYSTTAPLTAERSGSQRAQWR